MSESRRPPPMRTYGSKPRKLSSTYLWDGSKDVPRHYALAENSNHLNERKNASGLSGIVKGVVGWLSPKKSRPVFKGSDKENMLSEQDASAGSHDDDHSETGDTSSATLVTSTPKKEEKLEAETKTGIDLLLKFCSEDEILGFSQYINGLLQHAEVKKLGEASYSEVFNLKRNDGTTAVLKIIPFAEHPREKDTSVTKLEDILQEIRISRIMTDVEGFADFQGATVVKGCYPESLLSAWDIYTAEKKSENYRPSRFPETQVYCVIQLAHHGQDLESHTIYTWSEAAYIFWSVVRILARGEQQCEFEHRDLHWGNILIDRSEEDEILERLLDNLDLEDGRKEAFDGGLGEAKVTLIDYTLSRARVNDFVGHTAHFDFEDETIFEGKRDYQFDIYRQMRAIVSNGKGPTWGEYRPSTNVLWLHYLANKLLYAKQLPTPVTRLSARNQLKQHGGSKPRGHERSFSAILEGEEKAAYDGLLGMYNKINPKNGNNVASASAVLAIGKENGWIS